MTTTKLGPKNVFVITFRIAMQLDDKSEWFLCLVAVGVNKWHKNAIYVYHWFQKFKFDCLLVECIPFFFNLI